MAGDCTPTKTPLEGGGVSCGTGGSSYGVEDGPLDIDMAWWPCMAEKAIAAMTDAASTSAPNVMTPVRLGLLDASPICKASSLLMTR